MEPSLLLPLPKRPHWRIHVDAGTLSGNDTIRCRWGNMALRRCPLSCFTPRAHASTHEACGVSNPEAGSSAVCAFHTFHFRAPMQPQTMQPTLACVCDGRPLQTNFTPVDDKKLILQIEQPAAVSEFCLCLLRSDIPANHGFGIFWAPPPFQAWQCRSPSFLLLCPFGSCFILLLLTRSVH